MTFSFVSNLRRQRLLIQAFALAALLLAAGIFEKAHATSAGALHLPFGNGGKLTIDVSNSYEYLGGMALQPDGKIILAGYSSSGGSADFLLIRYHANGTLDQTFGTGGKVLTNFGGMDIGGAVALQTDGKIVVGGATWLSGQGYAFALARYNPNGTLDTTFGAAGMVVHRLGTMEDQISSLAVQADGKIIAAGHTMTGPNADTSFAVVRYNSNGSLDNFFGNGGKVLTRYNHYDSVHALAIQPDGNILAAGHASSSATGDLTLARYVGAASPTVSSDFDGDGKTDFAVFRPSDGSWYIVKSSGGFSSYYFGQRGDFVVPADYDGDGKTDVAIWRRDMSFNGQSVFYVLRSSDNSLQIQPWGNFRDLPMPADYEGDGKADFAVYRNGLSGADSAWYIKHSSDSSLRSVTWGAAGDIPQPVGDRDGDGKADLTVRRFAPGGTANDPHPATFYTLLSSNNSLDARAWGLDRDREAHGDYDGDGKMDTGVFRWGTDPAGSPGTFYILKNNGESITQHWGSFGDFSTPGDYDGDGLSDLAVWRPTEGVFYVMKSTGGIITQAWGKQGDLPTTVFLGN